MGGRAERHRALRRCPTPCCRRRSAERDGYRARCAEAVLAQAVLWAANAPQRTERVVDLPYSACGCSLLSWVMERELRAC